ncbi:hypothetical protein V8E36_003876, partial [Tilletia maclaganii]
MSSETRSNHGEDSASAAQPAVTSPSPTQVFVPPGGPDVLVRILDRLESINEGLAQTRADQSATGRRVDEILERLYALERARDGRAPSPDTMFPAAAKQESGVAAVRFSAQDARSGTPLVPRGLVPPHMVRSNEPDVSISRIPSAYDASMNADRSLSQRVLEPGIPDSDRMKVLEQDFDTQAAQGGRK